MILIDGLPRKFIVVISVQIALSFSIGSLEYFQTTKLMKSLDEQLMLHLPANRNALIIEGASEKIKAGVFHLLLTKEDTSANFTKQVQSIKRTIGVLNSSSQELSHINLGKSLQDQMDHLKNLVKSFNHAAETLVAGKSASEVYKNPSGLAEFNNAFTALNKLTTSINEEIETAAYDKGLQTREMSKKYSQFGMMLISFGILFGMCVGYLNFRSISKILNQMLASLLGGLSNMSDSTTQLVQEANELKESAFSISNISTGLAESANKQSAALEETASAVDEVQAMVQKNADSSSNSTVLANSSLKVAAQARDAIQELSMAMVEIKNSNNEILRQSLESNNHIAEKTKIVNDIVFQTKLLSFNASVESARAGEYGRGFAIVAEEIGNLAQMSGGAAKEISKMISENSTKIENVVSSGKTKLDNGDRLTKQCREILDLILKNAEGMMQAVNEVANATNEQSRGISEISKAMGHLSQSINEIVGSSQNASNSSKSLLSQANMLNRIVEQQQVAVQVGNDANRVIVNFVKGNKTDNSQAITTQLTT